MLPKNVKSPIPNNPHVTKKENSFATHMLRIREVRFQTAQEVVIAVTEQVCSKNHVNYNKVSE